MRSRDRLPTGPVDRGLGILTAWIGAVLGGGAGSLSLLFIARALGIQASVANYGVPYFLVLAGAWLGAALGSYFALRLIGNGLAARSSAILLALLAAPGLLAATRTDSGPGWPSAWEWAVTFMTFVVLPLAAPAIASLLAEAATRRRASS